MHSLLASCFEQNKSNGQQISVTFLAMDLLHGMSLDFGNYGPKVNYSNWCGGNAEVLRHYLLSYYIGECLVDAELDYRIKRVNRSTYITPCKYRDIISNKACELQ